METRQDHTHPQKSLRFISLAILAIFLAACNLPQRTPAIPTFTVMPTNTNTPVVNTPTPTSPVPLPSNPTPTATTNGGTNPGSPTNILFSTGTTAAVESGTIQPGQVKAYTINVGNSQPMILLLHSTNGDAFFAIYDANGNVVLDPAKKWSRWQELLPAKVQLYTINVIGGATAGDYTLTVKVPARISFASGATSASVTASTAKGYVFSYTISGAANQTMTANLTVPANTAAMDIFGLATGDSLLGVSAKGTTFTGPLPSTQDYIIEVFPLQGNVVNFSLVVSIH